MDCYKTERFVLSDCDPLTGVYLIAFNVKNFPPGTNVLVCWNADRIRFKPDLESPGQVETDPELDKIEEENRTMPRSHYSSDNIKSLTAVHIPRPSSTPCVMNMAADLSGNQPTAPPEKTATPSRKPPPRPPAISKPQKSAPANPPPRPTQNPQLPPGEVTSDAAVGLTNGNGHVINMSHLDFSVFEEVRTAVALDGYAILVLSWESERICWSIHRITVSR